MSDMADRIAHGASSVAYTASGSAVVAGGLTTNEMIAIGGLVLGLLTFFVNWYYRHKHYQLELAKAERRLHDYE